jgi:LacI family transcriptional regulator
MVKRVTRCTTPPDDRPVRMDDVARATGLSRTTVSLVLNDKAGPSIPEATRERVRAASIAMGYRPNALAAGLRRRTTDTIGLISDQVATTPWAGPMLRGAQEVAWAAGKLITVVDTEGDAAMERAALAMLLERRVDGIVLATMFHRVLDEPPVELRSVPAVLLDARATDASLPSFVPDDLAGGRGAVAHLVAAGHRRIGMVQVDVDVPAARERLQGYREVLAQAGIPFEADLVVTCPGDAAGGAAGAGALLDRTDPPTALFCFNDRLAMGAYRAARKRGLAIPDDVSVVGYDNHEVIAPWLEPALTTVQLPHLEMGRAALEHLLAMIDGRVDRGAPPPQVRLPCPLVVRDSVAPPCAKDPTAGGAVVVRTTRLTGGTPGTPSRPAAATPSGGGAAHRAGRVAGPRDLDARRRWAAAGGGPAPDPVPLATLPGFPRG